MNLSTLLVLALIGLAAGILGGMAGVGGGVIVIPALVFVLGMSQVEAQGTSLGMMLPPIGIMAAFNYYREGHLNWKYAMVLALFFIIGGYFGSKWVLQMPQDMVRKSFAVFIIVIGIKMLFGK